jgi:hypothetical protein
MDFLEDLLDFGASQTMGAKPRPIPQSKPFGTINRESNNEGQ